MHFFAGGVERWGRDMMHLWGSLNICPCLNHLELPCHSSEELHSICKLKVWGNIQEPCSNLAYLLVQTRETLEAQDYSMSLVWVSPNQVQAPTMEEALRALSAYISSRPDWPKERWRGVLMGRLANLKSASSFLPGHKSSIL